MPHSLRLLRSTSMGSVCIAAAAAAAIAAVGSADSLECLMCVRGDLGDDAFRNESPIPLPRLLQPRMDVLIEIGPLPLAGVTDRDGDEPTPERSNFLLFRPAVPLDLFILLNPPEPPRSPPPWVDASSDTCVQHQRGVPCSKSTYLQAYISKRGQNASAERKIATAAKHDTKRAHFLRPCSYPECAARTDSPLGCSVILYHAKRPNTACRRQLEPG